MTNADWKDVIEEYLIDYRREKYYAMSLSELQTECDRLGLDYSELFK